jgi:hypothetical protein
MSIYCVINHFHLGSTATARGAGTKMTPVPVVDIAGALPAPTRDAVAYAFQQGQFTCRFNNEQRRSWLMRRWTTSGSKSAGGRRGSPCPPGRRLVEFPSSSLHAATRAFMVWLRPKNPRPTKPMSIIAQVDGSGIGPANGGRSPISPHGPIPGWVRESATWV